MCSRSAGPVDEKERNIHMPLTKRVVRVCVDCGARYATPAAPARHKAVTGHSGFKNVSETVDLPAPRISYQPGYGPTGDAA